MNYLPLFATSPTPLIRLETFDWVVVGLYGIFMLYIALRVFPRIKDCGGFFVGSRKMNKLSLVAAAFAGGTNATHPMAVAAATFQKGMPGVWLSLTWILITPFLWMYPPAIRRLRIITTVDVVKMRYGTTMASLFKIVSLISVPVGMGLGIKSAAILLEVMTGGAVAGNWAIAAVCIPTLVYTLLGGVVAAYLTDIYQGLLIVLLSFLLIPFAIHHAGGIGALELQIDREMMSLFSGGQGEFGFWWILWFAIGITFAASVSTAPGSAAATDEMTARMKVWGTIIKRFCTLGWGWVGVLGLAMYAGHPLLDSTSAIPGGSPDNVFAFMSGELLPVGLRGLMVAAIMAAVMSSLDASTIYFSSIAVSNLYQEHMVRQADARHYLLMARVFCVVALLLGWWVASGVEDIVYFATIAEPINGVIGMAIFVALVWRRVTAWGAVASVLVSVPLYLAVSQPEWGPGFSLFQAFQLQPISELMAGWYGIDFAQYLNADGRVASLPVQIRYPLYIVPSLTTIVVISWLTRQHSDHAVGEFYCRLDTPIGEEHKISEQGYEVDDLLRLDKKAPDIDVKASGVGSRLLLIDCFYLPGKIRRGEVRLSDYKWDWIGLFGFSAFVALFVLSIEFVATLFN